MTADEEEQSVESLRNALAWVEYAARLAPAPATAEFEAYCDALGDLAEEVVRSDRASSKALERYQRGE